jgi:hypothetical protein
VEVQKGSTIEVRSAHVGEPVRRGEVLEVISLDDPVELRVAWEDGHESVFYPSGGTVRVVDGAA